MRGLVYVALVTVLVASCSYFGFQLDRAGERSFWLLAVGPSVVLAFLALAMAYKNEELGSLLRPAWGDFTRGVLGTAVMFGVAYAFARACAGTPRELWLARLYAQIGEPETLRAHLGVLAGLVVVAAAAEEIVWRGMVISLLEESLGSRRAWIGAAIAYAAAQLPTVWALRDPVAGPNPMLVLGALAGGLVWGGLTRAVGGRLLPAIVAHAMFDWLVVATFRLWGTSL